MFDQAKINRARELSRPQNLTRTGASWFRISNQADATDVYIYDEIGLWGVTADDFVRELNAIDAESITLHLNSPGGDVFDGIAMYNALRDHAASVTVVVDGLAASAASFIAMAGDTVRVQRNARMMIHDASGLCIGNAAAMEEMRDLLDDASNNIADIYSQKAGGDVADWRAAMKNTTWYSAQEAVDAGLADELLDSSATDNRAATNQQVVLPVAITDGEIDFEQLLQGVDLGAIMKESR